MTQNMVRKLSATLFAIVWFLSIIYLGLLTNWFRYPFSLESSFVALPLIIGIVLCSILAVVAFYIRGRKTLVATFLVAVITGGVVVHRQVEAFEQMPSINAEQVDKSPIGKVKASKEEAEYWIELKNPFANSHHEYLVIKRGNKENRVEVPIFNGHVGGYAGSDKVEDWGTVEATSQPDTFIFTVGENLISPGRFKVNLATGQVEKMKL